MYDYETGDRKNHAMGVTVSLERKKTDTAHHIHHRILLVDDDPNLLKAIGWALEDKGYHVTKASGGEEAIEVLRKRNLDLVITDLSMRQLDGIDVLRKAKEIDPRTTVIIMTANTDVSSAVRALRDHADDYMLKPFNLYDLYERVAQCLEKTEREHRTTAAVSPIAAANQQVQTLTKSMSHDIRGSLVTVSATLKLLLRGLYGSMDQEVSDKLNELNSKITRLIGIAEDYLVRVVSSSGDEEIDKEEVDLKKDIIVPVLDDLYMDIKEKQIRIDHSLFPFGQGSVPIRVNKILLRTVYRNLLMNAIKYGGHGCTIAYGVSTQNSTYRLNVYNSGKPVPKNFRDKLFRRFVAVGKGSSEGDNGLSIGLLLVQQIIRQHGGEIWYEPRGNGSDFIFTLPRN